MADTRIQLEIERWIRTQWLPVKYGQQFQPKGLTLRCGGTFQFDAVSDDGSIVASISTSSGTTQTGKYPSAKVQKLRADMLFLLLTTASKRLIVLTEKDMLDLCRKEQNIGRVPEEIEFEQAEIPEQLRKVLLESRRIASREVTPEIAGPYRKTNS